MSYTLRASGELKDRVSAAIERAHARGMTYLEMSQRAGVSEAVIHKWKKKGSTPKPDMIFALAKAIDENPADLLGFS